MKLARYNIVFQEHPKYISLGLWISGCDVHCPDCHSKDLWDSIGVELSPTLLSELIDKYKGFVDNIIFFGGEWEMKNLVNYLSFIRTYAPELKLTLWTGREDVPRELKECLDYLKTGPYKPEFGDLRSPTTNQRYINLNTGENVWL